LILPAFNDIEEYRKIVKMAKKQSFFMKIIQICQAFFTLDEPHLKASTRRPFLSTYAEDHGFYPWMNA